MNPSLPRPSLPQDVLDQIAREERHFSQAAGKFFQAWKRGVEIAGSQWFGDGTRAGLQSAASKWDLCPQVAPIQDALGVLSGGERMFLAALVSFYDSCDGGELLKRCDFQGLADLAGLDLDRRQVLAELLLYYDGW
ncbi:MAG: hypothetical protein LBS49_09780 [Candidatus Accumulibacter sp.]|jgi:hypothetical protein|nr:hypothetical protein [Accumulibacter sp.]